ncbi:copper amine oxidase N-terminal domain-containing protein [Gorillibacterium sp. sgz5001074]|uniref:copper amine oxidase N-terminal domain-containing protein n=1 Tax=Gorillibacterium sp. sgz5001074 TaxID=3446695 RepID=UPI003F663F7D
MMKKNVMALMVALLAFGGASGAVYAKQEDAGNGKKAQDTAAVQEADQGPGQGKGPQWKLQLETGSTTVTGDTYGKGYRGLLNAIEHVQDKPAGAVIADLLLTKYDAHLTAEMKAKLEGIVAKDEALSLTADMLAQQGSVTDAVYVQKEAVKANVKNLESYKKLGQLYEKVGKTGIKLYVNGDEPAMDVAPIIKNDYTLVPFRAIAEALKAEVSYNEEENSVTVVRGDVTVKLYVGQTTAYVNGVETQLQIPAEIVNDRTVVPVRFVSEALKSTVKWEGETESVVIYEE